MTIFLPHLQLQSTSHNEKHFFQGANLQWFRQDSHAYLETVFLSKDSISTSSVWEANRLDFLLKFWRPPHTEEKI